MAAFHTRALKLGASKEGDPGERAPGAYFRDLDGNKLRLQIRLSGPRQRAEISSGRTSV